MILLGNQRLHQFIGLAQLIFSKETGFKYTSTYFIIIILLFLQHIWLDCVSHLIASLRAKRLDSTLKQRGKLHKDTMLTFL